MDWSRSAVRELFRPDQTDAELRGNGEEEWGRKFERTSNEGALAYQFLTPGPWSLPSRVGGYLPSPRRMCSRRRRRNGRCRSSFRPSKPRRN